MSLKIGNLAPNFKLKDQNGKTIELKDFRGEKNILLYFYPKANTPGCTVQACSLRDSKRKFTSRDTVILGISPDPVDKLKKFEEKQKLNFTLLSDEGHKIAEKYGVWGLKKFMGKEYMGIFRQTFLIGKDGRLKEVAEKVKTKTHHEDMLERMKEVF